MIYAIASKAISDKLNDIFKYLKLIVFGSQKAKSFRFLKVCHKNLIINMLDKSCLEIIYVWHLKTFFIK